MKHTWYSDSPFLQSNGRHWGQSSCKSIEDNLLLHLQKRKSVATDTLVMIEAVSDMIANTKKSMMTTQNSDKTRRRKTLVPSVSIHENLTYTVKALPAVLQGTHLSVILASEQGCQ